LHRKKVRQTGKMSGMTGKMSGFAPSFGKKPLENQQLTRPWPLINKGKTIKKPAALWITTEGILNRCTSSPPRGGALRTPPLRGGLRPPCPAPSGPRSRPPGGGRSPPPAATRRLPPPVVWQGRSEALALPHRARGSPTASARRSSGLEECSEQRPAHTTPICASLISGLDPVLRTPLHAL